MEPCFLASEVVKTCTQSFASALAGLLELEFEVGSAEGTLLDELLHGGFYLVGVGGFSAIAFFEGQA